MKISVINKNNIIMNIVKQRIRLVVLSAVLCVLSVSCEKEKITNDATIVVTTYSAVYVVDGQQYYDNPQTEEEWTVFIDRMLALAEEGHTVQFWRSGVQASATKEKITFTTTNHAEAEAWCRQKKNEGYAVTITYDQGTGKYT